MSPSIKFFSDLIDVQFTNLLSTCGKFKKYWNQYKPIETTNHIQLVQNPHLEKSQA